MAAVIAFMAIVSLWVPFLDTQIADRWFAWPNLLYLSPVPILVALVSLGLFRAIQARKHYAPFLLALALFTLGYAGLAISLFPNVVPPDISIWQASSPPETQGFMLVGVLIMLPVILGYTAYTYWVFRGKVATDAGYH
jgi:cytochrome d ubiquinol oxidase subunit II